MPPGISVMHADCETYTVPLKCNVALACNSFARLSKLVTLLSTIWYMHVYKIFEGQGLGQVTNPGSLKYADH